MSSPVPSADPPFQRAEEISAHDYIELKTLQDVEALEQHQLYSYIEKLHGIIRKYDSKIAIYKKKLKHYVRGMNSSIYVCVYSSTTNVLHVFHCRSIKNQRESHNQQTETWKNR